MRLIIEADGLGLPGRFYADMQEEADKSGTTLTLSTEGLKTAAGVTILAIELGDGRFGWLKGHRDFEASRQLLTAAAILEEEGLTPESRPVWEYLTSMAARLGLRAYQAGKP